MKDKYWIFLFIVYLLFSMFKIVKVFHSPYFTRDESCIYWTESAFQYRYAKMVAKTGKIPRIDRMVEYPDGFNVKANHPVLMEVVAGLTYRFLHLNVPFHYFLLIFMSLFTSLPVLCVYSLSSHLWRSKTVGIFSSIAYSVSIASSITVLNMAYELQDFALIFIFSHIYYYILSVQHKIQPEERLKFSILSGVFLFIALSSWHLTQFYYLAFLLQVLVGMLFIEDFPRMPFIVISGFAILGGISIPILYSGKFLISLPMLFNYAMLLPSFLSFRRRKIFIPIMIVLAGIIYFLLPLGMFNPVLKKGILPLTIAKISHLGKRPANPAGLSWETLVIWTHPLNTPTIKWTVKALLFHLVWGIPGIVILFKNGGKRHLPFLFFTLFFLFSYLLFERMDVFCVFFLSVSAGFIFYRKYLTIAAMISMVPLFFYLYSYKPVYTGPQKSYLIELLEYIRNDTEKDAVFLTPFAYGPDVLLWGKRKVIFHPKFESLNMVKNLKKFEHLLFKDEDSFYKFCVKSGADYFLLTADMLLSKFPSSLRYRTHNLVVYDNSVLFKFHFHPESLKYFYPVFTNPHYRLFKIKKEGFVHSSMPQPYFPVYDEKRFNLESLGIRK